MTGLLIWPFDLLWQGKLAKAKGQVPKRGERDFATELARVQAREARRREVDALLLTGRPGG